MKQLFFLLILSIPLFPQYTLPPFGAKPADVWKYLKINNPGRVDTLIGGEIIRYTQTTSSSTDSLEGASYTFFKDSLVRATYEFNFRGDLTQALDFFEKKNKGYEWGHGSRQKFIKIEDLGSIWYDFTLPQVAQFIRAGHFYICEYYMKKDYRLTTFISHLPEFNFTKYTATFTSADAYARGIID